MGGAGSVTPYNGKRCSKAEETSLLRTYNRQDFDDKFYAQLSTTNVRPQTVASLRDVAHHGGGANMDSKDGAVSIPGQATTKPYPSPQVPEERLRHSNTFCHAAQECGKSMFVRSATNASAVDTERCRQTKISVHQRRAERTRARENVLMQMYNRSHHADLGSGLRTLRSLFHQCSINGTGWATVATVSAALGEVGVSIDNQAILLLVNLADEPDDVVQPAKIIPKKATTADNLQLVYWPTIVTFLETGRSTEADDAACLFPQKQSFGPARIVDNQSVQDEKLATRHTVGDEISLPRADNVSLKLNLQATGLADSDAKKENGPEVTPEAIIGSGSGIDHGGNDEGSLNGGGESIKNIGSWQCRLEQGLCDVEASLCVAKVQDQILSPRRLQGTMDEIQEIIRINAGVHCTRRRNGGYTVVSGSRVPSAGKQKQRHPKKTRVDGGINDVNFDVPVDDNGIPPPDISEAETLANASCAAGKRGDVSALKDLAGSVDLRKNDAFGRNALYYACLCGHVGATHFVAVRAYGGAKEIPEQERWECRKNALSDEIRHYLDTGVLPRHLTETAKSPEQRAGQVVPVKGRGRTPRSSEKGVVIESREGRRGSQEDGDESAELSIASLFSEKQ